MPKINTLSQQTRRRLKIIRGHDSGVPAQILADEQGMFLRDVVAILHRHGRNPQQPHLALVK